MTGPMPSAPFLPLSRTVASELEIYTYGGCDLELQLAVARSPGLQVDESLLVTSQDGAPVPVVEVETPHHGRLHLVTLPPGFTQVRYDAQVRGRADVPTHDLMDLSLYRRPSRYIESDAIPGFASAEFSGLSGKDLLVAVSSWVGTRLLYVPGSSGHMDGAVDTLITGAGVCRDFAHLVIALLRALRVPARLLAVYAPGCDPMDFHAVAEAFVDGAWYVVDSSALAPRTSLVRIATGRDAADTAFMTTVSGDAELTRSLVSAVADDGLPLDDLDQTVALG
ncbi:MAG: transglutaminase family protein [Propionibacteriales bacterium]|nr:transglutaminase family protein [Propionibacteriales bacterium]